MFSLEEYMMKSKREEDFYACFGGVLTEELEQRFKDNDCYDFINEMLKSHDASKLISELQKAYGTDAKFYKATDDTLSLVCARFSSPLAASKFAYDARNKAIDTPVSKILNFFNYFVTDTRLNVVVLEPEFPEEIDEDYLMNVCHNSFMHITKNENVESILRTGLRPRNDKSDNFVKKYFKETGQMYSRYREFPKRTYLFALDCKKEEYDNKIKDILEALHIDEKYWKNYTALQVVPNTSRFGVKLYRDMAMPGRDDCYFTNECIRSEWISEYKKLSEL